MVADSSAWIEFLRGTGGTAHRRLAALVADRAVIVTDPVLMEILAGARSRSEWLELRRLMSAFDFASVEGPDWVDAAALQWRLRRAGQPVKSIIDCLIAVVAIRLDVPLLTADEDFARIAAHSDLELA